MQGTVPIHPSCHQAAQERVSDSYQGQALEGWAEGVGTWECGEAQHQELCVLSKNDTNLQVPLCGYKDTPVICNTVIKMLKV